VQQTSFLQHKTTCPRIVDAGEETLSVVGVSEKTLKSDKYDSRNKQKQGGRKLKVNFRKKRAIVFLYERKYNAEIGQNTAQDNQS